MNDPIQKMPKLNLNPWPWVLAGAIGILLLFGGLGTFAAVSKISGAIIAQGTLGVESKVKTIQHLEGGIVGQILVHDGDLVKAGQLLIRLDDSAKKASYTIVTGHLNELNASMARLKAERDGAKVIPFGKSLLAQQDNREINAMIKDQTALFEVRKKGKLGQERIFRQRIVQLNEQIKGLQTQRKAKHEQANIIAGSFYEKSLAAQRGVVSGDTMDNIRRQKAQLTGDIGDLQARIAQARGSIEEIEQKILQIDKEFREKVLEDIRENQTRTSELREKQTALQEQLRRTDIRAPQAGRVHNMSIFTVGGVISPAESILQIIPGNAHLIVEARIEPTDLDQVKIGQPAAIHLTAFDSRTTPILDGLVKNISAAQMIDAATQRSYFTVEILIPKDQRQRLNEGQKLLPGMPAEIFITTGQRTPLNYFLKPLMAQIQRAFKEQ